jgi:3-hydroxy-9,10-secoandrosta-1,3,5(10)-triene-9,17-dione monooxygenase
MQRAGGGTVTSREIVARAEALRPGLIERQAETEELTYYPEITHREFLEAGFYRILQPRRYGGLELDVPTFVRVIMEVSRGCVSTGWCLCLSSAHVLQVASSFGEEAQDEIFGSDGDFRCASFGAPVGVAQPVDGGWEIEGTFPYASGIPYSTHFLGQTFAPGPSPDGPPGPPMMFVAPRSIWQRMDDWGDAMGLKGSGSHSVHVSGRLPSHLVVEGSMLDVDVSQGTPGSRLHGNPMYAGRNLGFFHAEFGAIVVGAAKGMLDEYERLITTRKTTWPPKIIRALHPDYQRHFGVAMGRIACAEAAVIQLGEQYMELCRRNAEEGIEFTAEDDQRLEAIGFNACRLAWEAAEGILFRTGGSSAARDGETLQRYWRDLCTYWSHNTPSQSDALARRLAMLHLGIPLEREFQLPAAQGA